MNKKIQITKKDPYVHADPGSAVAFQPAYPQANIHGVAARPDP